MAKNRITFKITSNRGAVVRAATEAAGRKAVAMGMEFRSTLELDVLSGQRSGREYTVPKTSTKYRASKPGEAPAAPTGTLRRSYKVGRLQTTGTRVYVRVGSALNYAEALEAGTKHMAKRPHLEPAGKLSMPAFRNILNGTWGI